MKFLLNRSLPCLFILLFCTALACSDDTASRAPIVDAGTGDVPSVPDTLPEPDATSDIEPDIATDTADAAEDVIDDFIDLELCVLGTRTHLSTNCSADEELDFGWLPLETSATRRFRVTNGGTLPVIWIHADAHFDAPQDAQYTVEGWRLDDTAPDPNDVLVSIEPPFQITPGMRVVFDLELTAGLTEGDLEDGFIDIIFDDGTPDDLFVTLPLVAEFGPCSENRASCDGQAATGCEVNVLTDNNHCGACGDTCRLANVDAQCDEGICKMVGSCSAGFDDCDKIVETGCETNITTSDQHCGACYNACTRPQADGSCNGQAGCDFTCWTGWDDCNNDLHISGSDGCEAHLDTSVNHCGACNNLCVLPNAVPGCSAAQCYIASCVEDHFKSCDGITATGCEADTRTDMLHCGDCLSPCQLPNAVATCDGGNCNVSQCLPGWHDCSDDPGCETPTLEDINNCGGCGLVCSLPNASSTCAQGSCGIDQCHDGYKSCSSAPGCETHIHSDLGHCGDCNKPCALPNSVMSCDNGGCNFVECEAGWVDLNGTSTDPGPDGCEYQCTPNSSVEDRPGDATASGYNDLANDTNCDGIVDGIGPGALVEFCPDDRDVCGPEECGHRMACSCIGDDCECREGLNDDDYTSGRRASWLAIEETSVDDTASFTPVDEPARAEGQDAEGQGGAACSAAPGAGTSSPWWLMLVVLGLVVGLRRRSIVSHQSGAYKRQ
ncbi:MAG: MYXO-CTERM sorting domain-containing protein [Bradymonadaceae bacterium]